MDLLMEPSDLVRPGSFRFIIFKWIARMPYDC